MTNEHLDHLHQTSALRHQTSLSLTCGIIVGEDNK